MIRTFTIRLIEAVAIIVVASTSAFADVKTIRAPVSCHDWLESRAATRKNSENYLEEFKNLYWNLGYLSGRNVESDSPRDVIGDTNPNLITDWLDKYCKQNPNDKTFDAMDVLFDKLAK